MCLRAVLLLAPSLSCPIPVTCPRPFPPCYAAILILRGQSSALVERRLSLSAEVEPPMPTCELPDAPS